MKTDMKFILAVFLIFTIIQIYAMPNSDPNNVWKPYFGKNLKKSIKNDKPKTEKVKVVAEDKKDKDDAESDDAESDNDDSASDASKEDGDASDDVSEGDDDASDDASEEDGDASDDSSKEDEDVSDDASIEDTDDDDDDDDDDDKDDDDKDSDEEPKEKSQNKKGDDAKQQKTVKPKKKSEKPSLKSITMDRMPGKKKQKSSKTKNKGNKAKPEKKKPTNPNQGPKGEKGDRGPKGEPGDGSSPSIPMQAALSTVLTNHFGPAKDTIVPFDLVLLDLGDNYDNDTGIFICTIPGTYVVSLYLMSHPGAKVNARIYINNRPIAALWADDNKNVGFYPSSSIQTVTPLEFGDQVYVMLVDGGYGESWVHANYNAFTVYLLYEETFMKKRR